MSKKEKRLGQAISIVMILLIGIGAAWGVRRDLQPKFHDVTILAGEEMPELADYLTEYAVAEKCAFVTDMSALGNTDVGDHSIVLRLGAREETVTLRIMDTIAPELEVQDLELTVGEELTPESAVTHLWDHSQVKLSFDREVRIPCDYSPFVLGVVAEDAAGNTAKDFITVRFHWLREELTLELGQPLTREMLLYAPEQDADLITDEALEAINTAPIGEHTLESTSGSRTLSCRITVHDTQPPVLQLKECRIYPYGWLQLSDFIVKAEDASGEVTLTMLTEPDRGTLGSHTVVIEARDAHGHVTTAETTLHVVNDMYAPGIYGADSTLTVEKYGTPDYLAGVRAWDNRDGALEVTVDASRVNTSAAGTYIVIYTARDSSGNETTLRRKVQVEHDEEDTAALVASLAESLSDDPEEIRDYVRSTIYYSTSWGGEDPVWTGFVNKHGNCYVHALCLKSILDLKGFNTQLIWVTNKTHYWLVIEIEPGVWRHIDPTPSSLHSRYSLMTDEQRYWTLSGRNWDREAWPACE